LDRIVLNHGNPSWFGFWFKHEEDLGPAKAEQCARWHELRKLQKANEANEGSGGKVN
jgi:hypothetical protein